MQKVLTVKFLVFQIKTTFMVCGELGDVAYKRPRSWAGWER